MTAYEGLCGHQKAVPGSGTARHDVPTNVPQQSLGPSLELLLPVKNGFCGATAWFLRFSMGRNSGFQ